MNYSCNINYVVELSPLEDQILSAILFYPLVNTVEIRTQSKLVDRGFIDIDRGFIDTHLVNLITPSNVTEWPLESSEIDPYC